MKRKKVLTIILVCMMSVSLVACGPKARVVDGNSSSGEEKSDNQEKMEISILHYATENDAKVSIESRITRQAIENFKAANPDITIIEEAVGHDVYETKLKTLAAANELPDIFTSLPTFMPTFYENGQIMDLKPVIEGDQEWSGRFLEGALGDYEYEDKILATSKAGIVNHVLLWNKEIFEECGIDEFPKNTDEFKVAVQKIKAKGYVPMAAGNKEKFILSSQVMPGFLMKFASADWYNEIKNYGNASFTDTEVVEAITYMDDLIKMGMFNEDLNSIDNSQGRQLYYDEKAAMYVEGSWIVTSLIDEGSEELIGKTEIAVFPPVTGREELADQIVGGQGWGFCLNSNLEGEKLKKSAELIKGLTSPELQGMLVEDGALAVTNNPIYDESKLHPFYLKFLDMYDAHPIIVGCPEVQLSAPYMEASYTGYQELSIGQLTPQELAESLQKAHEEGK